MNGNMRQIVLAVFVAMEEQGYRLSNTPKLVGRVTHRLEPELPDLFTRGGKQMVMAIFWCLAKRGCRRIPITPTLVANTTRRLQPSLPDLLPRGAER